MGCHVGTIVEYSTASGAQKFRARIRRMGHGEAGKTFNYRTDAELWIREKESSILDSRRMVKKTESIEKIRFFKSGCYALFRGKKCIYVGSSERNIFIRIANHASRFEFDSFSIFPCEQEKLLAYEYKMIYELQPENNKLGKRKFKT